MAVEYSRGKLMDMASERIAFFLPLLAGGGAERVMVNLAHGFVRRGLLVDLVLGNAEGPYLTQVPKEARLVDLKCSRILTSIPSLVRYLKEVRPKVVISALDHANLAGLWASRLSSSPTKVVITLHNTFSEKQKNVARFSKVNLSPYLMKKFYPWADGIVAVSSGVAEDYEKIARIPRGRIRVIYNPVVTPELISKATEPLDHPWFSSGGPPVVISVGRLTKQKNYVGLIRAFRRIDESFNARLLILGEGELRTELEALVEELGLQERVSMPGFVLNPYQYMANSAVFVLSSGWEGLPTVLIEALALGVPVVSTDCKSGPSEILMGGKFGKLVPVDNVPALTLAIEESLSFEKHKKNRNAYERFEPDWAVDGYLGLIEEFFFE